MSAFPVLRAADLEDRPKERLWLVHDLWADEAVGILGGEPKCFKSFLALDVAVSVASGAPCLRHFEPARVGPVLLFAAEDAAHVVRQRLVGIALAADTCLDALDIHVITAPVVRLDLAEDRAKLRRTVETIQPVLLVLDPFVRLHRVDENTASEVAPILAWLRELQRELHMAVLLVHHSRKGAAHARAGQALRGSSELHAWGDSNLYLRRKNDRLLLSVEHRAAPSASDLAVELHRNGDALALRVTPSDDAAPAPSELPASTLERVERALIDASGPLSLHDLRRACAMRTASVCDTLAILTSHGRVERSTQGYRLVNPA